jgi:hypothetical protein
MNLLLLLLFSCGNGVSKVQTKKIKNDTTSYSYKKDGILYLDLKSAKDKKVDINLSDICDSVIYIPLETKKNCLLTHINQIEIDRQNIFIHSFWSLFRFDISGKFLNQYGKTGRGPGEYVCQGFCLDKKNKIVYPSTIYRNKRYKYTYGGEFLKSFPKESNTYQCYQTYYNSHKNTFVNTSRYYIFSRKECGVAGNQILISEVNKLGDFDNIIYSRNFTSKNFNMRDKCSYSYYISNMYIYNDSRIMVSEMSNDTLFEYKNNKLHPKVILNNKEFRTKLKAEMFYNIKANNPTKKFHKIREIITKNSYSIVVNESRRYMFLSSLDGLEYIYDKVEDKLRCVKINQDIDCLGNVDFTSVINNKYFYKKINADKFIELAEESLKSSKYPDKYKSKLKSVLGKINEESNPILILYKIKN